MKRLVLIALAIFSLYGTTSTAQNKHNATTPKDPATLPLPDDKKPVILDTLFADSKIYPNTVRDIKVMVPQQYDGTTPACLVVGLDGNLFGAMTVIPNLIGSGEMPVTIGVFVQPGTSKDSNNNVIRYNRSNEFDRTDARLATFLEEEVLPMVEKMVTPDGRKIILSNNPNDRAITGASSSGIAAFTAAWERPDMFARVYSSVGTFVAMRGGNEYPAIVRKSEPKPLRIFLQDGVNDTWNHIFGDWWEQNQLMSSALNYAGYEFDYKWDRGSHSIYYGTRAYPDAMRWLWRGWPAAVEAGTSMNDMLKSLLVKNGNWEEVTPNNYPGLTEEIAILIADPVGMHKLTDNPGANRMLRHNGVKISKFVRNPYRMLGLASGDKYISNTEGEIFLLKKEDKKAVKLETLPTSGKEIAITPDGKMLIAGEKNSNWLISYIIAPDGSLTAGQQFYWLHNTENHTNTPYGNMTFDTLGNLYIATPIGVQVCDQNGRVRAILALPGKEHKVDSIAFVGNTLYAKSGDKLYMRKLAHKGWNCWEAPISVKSQGQG